MTNSPLATDILCACGDALIARLSHLTCQSISGEEWDAVIKTIIRAFLANWRPEVSDGMIHAACPLYNDQCDLDGSIGPMTQAALDVLMQEARGGA